MMLMQISDFEIFCPNILFCFWGRFTGKQGQEKQAINQITRAAKKYLKSIQFRVF